MATFFVSDIHLSAARPSIVDDFIGFLEGAARGADALYILGDCFDLYLGDDDDTAPHARVVASLRALTATEPVVSVVRGNHDFLMGADFERASGCRVLEDLTVIDLYDTRILIMHGDTLCLDDEDYQAFRRYSRDPGEPTHFLESAARSTQTRSRTATRQVSGCNPTQARGNHGCEPQGGNPDDA